MNFQFELGGYLDPKEPKNHILFSNRMERVRTELENFINEWFDRDAPNMYINLSPKLELCTVGDIHSGPAKIIILSTRIYVPRVEILFPMNETPSVKFLMNIDQTSIPLHDLMTDKEFGYELVGCQIPFYVWSQINRYFTTGEILVNTELVHYSSVELDALAKEHVTEN